MMSINSHKGGIQHGYRYKELSGANQGRPKTILQKPERSTRFSQHTASGLEYLLLDEALSKNLMEVVELDNDGSVPELKVVNKSPEMILILDGEELVGAKQNRIVNTTIHGSG